MSFVIKNKVVWRTLVLALFIHFHAGALGI